MPAIRAIYTAHVHRHDGSDMGLFAEIHPPIAKRDALVDGTLGVNIYPELAPAPGEHVIKKHRYSAFFGTDLDIILRGAVTDTVIISGTTTENCCHATARDAMFRNYRVVFLSDATATYDYPDRGFGPMANADVHHATLVYSLPRRRTSCRWRILLRWWHVAATSMLDAVGEAGCSLKSALVIYIYLEGGSHVAASARALKTALLAAGSVLPRRRSCGTRHSAPIRSRWPGIHDASGGLDIYGKPMIACLEFAVVGGNAAGGLLGREIKLINYDPQSNIQLYTQFATQAATKDTGGGGPWRHHLGLARGDPADLRRFNTLYFYNTRYEGGVCDRNISAPAPPRRRTCRSWCRTCCRMGQEGLHPGGRLQLRPDHQQWITKYTREGGGEVLAADFFPLDVTDFGPAISKIQAAKPDAVMSGSGRWRACVVLSSMGRGGHEEAYPDGLDDARRRQRAHLLSTDEGDGIVSAFSYFQEVDNPLNKAFLANSRPRSAPTRRTFRELPMRTYIGFNLWADGVKRKARSTDRMKVIEALESGISMDTPAGMTTLDPKTHHTTLDYSSVSRTMASITGDIPAAATVRHRVGMRPERIRSEQAIRGRREDLGGRSMDYAAVVVLQIVQQVATLAIVSLGLAVVFGMMRVINLAHGEFLMLGGYAAILAHGHGCNLWLAILVVPPLVVGAIGAVVERLLIRGLYGRMVDTMLATWGLSLALIGAVNMLFGNSVIGLSAPLGNFAVGQFHVAAYDLFLVLAAGVLATGVWIVLRFTAAGLIARGTMQNAEMAAALGVAPERVYAATFTAGAALSGLAGGLIAPLSGVVPTMGAAYIAKAFIIVITGGTAILTGTLTASLLLGTVWTIATFSDHAGVR